MSTRFANNIFKPEKSHHPQILSLYNKKTSTITNTIKKIVSLNPTNGVITTALKLIMMTKIPSHYLIKNLQKNINNSLMIMCKENLQNTNKKVSNLHKMVPLQEGNIHQYQKYQKIL